MNTELILSANIQNIDTALDYIVQIWRCLPIGCFTERIMV